MIEHLILDKAGLLDVWAAMKSYVFGAASNLIPHGVILMWHGSSSNIPSGWALCDGQNSTPDLRDKMVVSSGTKYSPGSVESVDYPLFISGSTIQSYALCYIMKL